MSETQGPHTAVIICEQCQKNYPEHYHRCPTCRRLLPTTCPYTGAELEYREPDGD